MLKAALACGVLASIHVTALLADFASPVPFATQQREYAFAPPTHIRWFDREGGFQLRPFVYARVDATNVKRYPVQFFVHGSSYQLGPVTLDRHLFGVAAPARLFLLGTDGFGRDQFSRLLAGGRISLTAGWLATILSLSIGTGLGALAGFYGGWLDHSIMRIGEASLTLPWLYLLLAGRAFLPLGVPAASAYLILIAVVGVLGWARPARVVRGLTLALRERGYVVAARGFGATSGYILRRHILPDALPVLVTQAAILVPQYILAELTLSFLGLGIDEPVPSWGNMLAAVQHYNILVSYWWMLVPALAPAAVSLCCFAIGDALLRRRRAVPL